MSSKLKEQETEINKLKEDNDTLLKKFIPKEEVKRRKEMLSQVSNVYKCVHAWSLSYESAKSYAYYYNRNVDFLPWCMNTKGLQNYAQTILHLMYDV